MDMSYCCGASSPRKRVGQLRCQLRCPQSMDREEEKLAAETTAQLEAKLSSGERRELRGVWGIVWGIHIPSKYSLRKTGSRYATWSFPNI